MWGLEKNSHRVVCDNDDRALGLKRKSLSQYVQKKRRSRKTIFETLRGIWSKCEGSKIVPKNAENVL
jgi:hypothetical protein